jgi:hypothetical protein
MNESRKANKARSYRACILHGPSMNGKNVVTELKMNGLYMSDGVEVERNGWRSGEV